MNLIGWIAGLYVVLRESRRKDIEKKKILIIFFSIIIGTTIFSKLFYVIGHVIIGDIAFVDFFRLSDTGYVFYGGLIGALAGLLVSSRYVRIDPWKSLDIFSLGVAIGLFFGRIGCFMAGCCYGKATGSWFSLYYTAEDVFRFPTQNLSSLYNLLTFTILSRLKYQQRFDGEIALFFFMFYSGFRFLVEFLRHNVWYFYGLSAAQLISLVVFVLAFWIYVKKIKSSDY